MVSIIYTIYGPNSDYGNLKETAWSHTSNQINPQEPFTTHLSNIIFRPK